MAILHQSAFGRGRLEVNISAGVTRAATTSSSTPEPATAPDAINADSPRMTSHTRASDLYVYGMEPGSYVHYTQAREIAVFQKELRTCRERALLVVTFFRSLLDQVLREPQERKDLAPF
jgi:hypothetical protein